MPHLVTGSSRQRGYLNIYDNSLIVTGGSGGAAYQGEYIYLYKNGGITTIKSYETSGETYELYPDKPYLTSELEYMSYQEVVDEMSSIIGNATPVELVWKVLD